MRKNRNTDPVETLAAVNPDVTSSPAMATALKEFKEEQAKKEAALAKDRLVQAQSRVDSAVGILRRLRAEESKAKGRVKVLAEALDAYVKSGDWAAYQEAVKEIPAW